MTSPGVEEYALRARSTCAPSNLSKSTSSLVSCLVSCMRVHVPLVVCDDAVIDLTLVLIALVVIVVFVVAIFHRILLCWRYTVYTPVGDSKLRWLLPNF